MGGYFLEYNNFVPADPLKTPLHIAPVWYFTPYYSILRAVPPLFNSQFPGVMAMGLAIMILFLLPWLDRGPVKSIRYRGGYFKFALAVFVVTFLVLGYLGTEPTNVWGQFGAWLGNADRATVAARVFTLLYFAFFILMPWYTAMDKTQAGAGPGDDVSAETTTMKKLLIALLLAVTASLGPQIAAASEAGYRLDHAPIDSNDVVSLQSGARTFVNYCLNCHSAQFMRYNRLRDIDLTESQIKDNLMLTGDKVGDTMKIAMTPEGRQGLVRRRSRPTSPVIARSRGADWLYTYLRTFYRDPKAASGWNNAVFPNVGMPHVLWTLQGERELEHVVAKEGGHESVEYKWTQVTEGSQNTTQYDATVRDLVNYLVWMGEPAANARKKIGVVVLYFLGVLFVLAYAMKSQFWKDVH